VLPTYASDVSRLSGKQIMRFASCKHDLIVGHLEQWSILPRDGAQCRVLFSI
jgi:hypothetical protein